MNRHKKVYKQIRDMRIIAGRFKGHRLPSPRGKSVRPTTDRVREAVFSAIEPRIPGSQVLELFAGTGAFGLEALSRGADSVVFVEKDRTTARSLSQVVRALGVENEVTIVNRTASQAVKWLRGQGKKFPIIFLDPPYEGDWISRMFSDPVFPYLIADNGIVIVEQHARSHALTIPGEFRKTFERRYGDTLVEMYQGSKGSVTGNREGECVCQR